MSSDANATPAPRRTDIDDHPDIVLGALEDGLRPSPDPDDWDRLITVVTGRPCPVCGTAIAVTLGPAEAVDVHTTVLEEEHDTSVPDDWQDGYAHPVHLYCDRPGCRWHGAAEWGDLLPVLEDWIQGDAPSWRDRVQAARRSQGGERA